MIEDYGRSDFKEIGTLSSIFPSFVRQCCRSRYDGTQIEVLEAYREVAIRTLHRFQKKYTFVDRHLDLLKVYDSSEIVQLIENNPGDSLKEAFYCLATRDNMGLPKRACLHCPKVSGWIKRMEKAGIIDGETGKRIQKY